MYDCITCGKCVPYKSHCTQQMRETYCNECGWPNGEAEVDVDSESHSPLACATSDCATGGTTSQTDRVDGVYCYRVTLSPKGDISEDLVEWFLKTYRANNKYVVCERGKSGQRHLHALIQFPERKQKRHFQTTLKRGMTKHHPDSIGKYAIVINACYNMVWYDEYLRKEAGVEDVDTDNFDAEQFRSALPDEATQEVLQRCTGRRPIAAWWHDHLERWINFQPNDPSYESACRYFIDRMFVKCDMEPIEDPRRRAQKAYTLHWMRTKNPNPDEYMLKFHRDMTEQYIRGAP